MKAHFKKLKNYLIYMLVLSLIRIFCGISRKSALSLGRYLGIIAFHILRSERRKALSGLKVAFEGSMSNGAIGKIALESFVNLGKNAADAVRLRTMSKKEIMKLVRAEGLENFDAALAEGKGTIAITGHLSNWELLAAYVSSVGYPLNVVGKPLYDPRFDRILVGMRGRWGMNNIARGKETRDIVRALRKGELVAFLIDQDTRASGTFVDFFGRPSHTPTGPALLAMKLGSPVVPVSIHREVDETYHVRVGKRVELVDGDLRLNTERCSKAVEKEIREHPEEWVWMHERWKTKPEGGY